MSRKSRVSTILGLLSVMVMLTEVAQGQSKDTNILSGKVTDEEFQSLRGVNVQLVSTNNGDVTNTKGYFHFTTSVAGKVEVRASMIGYEPAVMLLNLEQDDSVYVELILRESSINLKEVLITASAYTTGEQEKGVTLQSLEVVTTPGAAADIFKALQTFPGVISVDEGSGLFVRGGDVSETVVVLDQATVMHPYKYESPTGGFFGTIPPFLISGTYFSSGGFSARYGNALSAVLAMESRELPTRPTLNLGLGLASGSVGADVPVISDKLGIQFSANQSFTDLMFRFNGVRHQFTLTPRGSDANMNLIYKYSTTGQVKIFNYVNTDRIGVRVDEPSFSGVYESEEINWLHNVQWKDVIANWLIKTSISLNRFDTERKLGSLNLKPSDYTYKLRVDAEHMISENHCLSIGAEQERMENRFEGTIPQKPTELDPNADVFYLDERYATNRFGAYTELESQLSRRWIASVGLRWDHHNIANESVFDPRTSLLFNLSKNANISLNWGLYHQFPQPIEYNQTSGNPNLHAQRAQHFIIGFGQSNNLMMLRIEAYKKVYDDLVLPAKITNYKNLGDGSAEGVDLFLKYGAFLLTPFSGWMSYSYLHSHRLQARDLITHYNYEKAPSAFEIAHNLTIVAKLQVIQFLSIGLTLHYATGRPVTPTIGAVYRSDRGYYEPIQGPINSERLPDFIRLDGSVSYFLPFGSSNSAVFYLGLSNLLNRANPVRYEYSFDYSEHRLRTTDYRRFIYFGVTVSFGSFGMGN